MREFGDVAAKIAEGIACPALGLPFPAPGHADGEAAGVLQLVGAVEIEPADMAGGLQWRPVESLYGARNARQACQPAGGLVDGSAYVRLGAEEMALGGVDVFPCSKRAVEGWQRDQVQEEASPQLRHPLENGEDAFLEAVMALAHR